MNWFNEKRSRRNRFVTTLLVLWDLGWRAAAIRVALKRHQMKWVISLATVSSMGLFPMFYLWRHRAAGRMPEDAAG